MPSATPQPYQAVPDGPDTGTPRGLALLPRGRRYVHGEHGPAASQPARAAARPRELVSR